MASAWSAKWRARTPSHASGRTNTRSRSARLTIPDQRSGRVDHREALHAALMHASRGHGQGPPHPPGGLARGRSGVVRPPTRRLPARPIGPRREGPSALAWHGHVFHPGVAMKTQTDRTPAPLRVLLVEGDDGAREDLGRTLEAAGHQVLLCQGPSGPDYSCIGTRGGRCALADGVDAVVLDTRLRGDDLFGGTTGWQLGLLYRDRGLPLVAGRGRRRDLHAARGGSGHSPSPTKRADPAPSPFAGRGGGAILEVTGTTGD
jgi:hypothetical protein